jgi:3-methyladenine DNA glycosylase/8-oxoguanine DNA glycosylase
LGFWGNAWRSIAAWYIWDYLESRCSKYTKHT